MPHIILMFPGQGSQNKGMGADIAQHFCEAREAYEEASDALNIDMKKLCFEDPSDELNKTEYTQVALLATSIAFWRALKSQVKMSPAFALGHSLGEYSALVCAGSMTFADALRTVRKRGQFMQEAVPLGTGSMVAYLGQHAHLLIDLCAEVSNSVYSVQVANMNSPGQVVLSGHTHAVQELMKLIQLKQLGKTIPLKVSAPFHSQLMLPAAQKMKLELESVVFSPNQIPVVANINAKIYQTGAYEKALLIEQICGSVLWQQSLQSIENNVGLESATTWIECGYGAVLQGLAKKTLKQPHCMSTSDLNSFVNTCEFLSR